MKKPSKLSRPSKPSAGPETKNAARLSRAVALSVAAGTAVSFLILCAFAALMSVRDLPHSAVVPMSILAVAAGTILSGYCCARILREKGLLWGLCCGTVIFLLAFFFYIDGVYTIIDMATAYGEALGMDSTGLLLALLVTQLVAFPFALIFG